MSPACGPVRPGIGETMLCILLLSGLCSSQHRYHFINEPKTWLEAQRYCREKYTDLASVDNMKDMERLIAAAGSGYKGKVWIGLYDKPESWLWSLSDPHFYGKGDQDFRRWNQNQPNNERGRNGLCVFSRGGFWHDYLCDVPRFSVCYSKIFHALQTTSTYGYVFIKKKMSWHQAQAFCRRYYTDIASVRNKAENDRLHWMVGSEAAAIGLHSKAWRWWSDNSSHIFGNWADGHPFSLNKSCAVSVINASHLGKWVENNCDDKLHFMCQHNKMQVFNVKLTILKSTVNLNDPPVTEAILNLIKERMKAKGMTRDLKISWIKNTNKNVFYKEEQNAVKTDLLSCY